ncbi:MAG: hypothetical protein Q4P18_06045 [Methanobrevibacter sp.]|uniref:hypothetical protein n=1 Tax=Methanobrevibacter sp. TaxID=66852 RepID=UPI0026DF7EA6|nr:hypothetical protein [Methanobrevibacter sp.]MDO5849075.1 hypothetical protein [Methanobrevibacter sp.]
MVEKLTNPLENYHNFNQLNADDFIRQWGRYVKEGINQLYDYVESRLSDFNASSVVYVPYFDDAFIPRFIIKIPKNVNYKIQNQMWDQLYDEMREFAVDNNILPVFRRLLFYFTN